MNLINTAQAATEKAGGISVHLNPYIVGHIGGMPITATLVTVWLVMILLTTLAFIIRKNLSLVPNKLQSVAETAIGGGYEYIYEVLGDKKSQHQATPAR